MKDKNDKSRKDPIGNEGGKDDIICRAGKRIVINEDGERVYIKKNGKTKIIKGPRKKSKVRKVMLMIGCCIGFIAFVSSIYYIVNRFKHPRLTFIGHATVKIVSVEGTVIYIDPYFPVGNYLEKADYILITHEHSDHNDISKCRQAEGCKIIHWNDAIKNGEYQTFEKDEVKIEAVPSGGGNANHNPKNCVGYIVTVDGVSLYHAGDTSMFDGLKQIAGKEIDYAMYPIDGFYNMGPDEASEVADMIGATYNIPIHGHDNKFAEQRKQFSAKGKLPMFWGEMIFMKKNR